MKKVLVAIAFVAVGFVSCKGEKKDKVEETKEPVAEVVKTEVTKAQDSNIDVTASVVTWKGTKPTGFHNGDVRLKSGNLDVENGTVKGGEFVIDMNTINTLDLKAGKGKEDLDGHLKNEDFFDVTKYPTSKFVIKSVEEKDGKLAVTGDLTVKETTKSLTVPVTVSTTDGVTTFKSDVFKVNRTEYGIKYKSKSFFNDLKNKFIDDEVEFSFDVKTKK